MQILSYIIVSIATATTVIATLLFFKRVLNDEPPAIRYSQSHVYNLIAPFIPDNSEMMPRQNTQSNKYLDTTYIKVAYVGDRAYWIEENSFYVARVVDGLVDESTAKQVDTMSMSKLELDKMLYIIEELNGDNNDNRNSRD